MLPNSFYGIFIRLPYAVFWVVQFRPMYLFSFKMLYHGSLLCGLNVCIMVCLATETARLTPRVPYFRTHFFFSQSYDLVVFHWRTLFMLSPNVRDFSRSPLFSI